jgi:formate hydrogenlyase transcriptional activator
MRIPEKGVHKTEVMEAHELTTRHDVTQVYGSTDSRSRAQGGRTEVMEVPDLQRSQSPIAFPQTRQLNDGFGLQSVPLTRQIRTESLSDEIVGESEALRRVLGEVERVASTDSTVLIYGETGSGKELIARAVHNLSPRNSRAFVKFNCAAIPTGLLESELFGHEKGAFTGAVAQRTGRFELAHGGTIFLDEIGEIPLELQPKLLRVLQEREFERLGSTRTIHTNARLIAATNRDLKSMVKEKQFRSDLFYRLNVFPIRVPALRERPEDIPLLVWHFVEKFSRRIGRAIESIPSQTMEALVHYDWPGNIRELQNVIESAVIVSKGAVPIVTNSELNASNGATCRPDNQGSLDEMLREAERTQILRALELANWLVAGPNGAAALLRINRSTLLSRMQRLGIRVSRNYIASGHAEATARAASACTKH